MNPPLAKGGPDARGGGEGRGFAVLGRWDLTAGQVQCGVEMGGFPTKGGHRLRRAADHQHAEHAEHLNMLNMRNMLNMLKMLKTPQDSAQC